MKKGKGQRKMAKSPRSSSRHREVPISGYRGDLFARTPARRPDYPLAPPFIPVARVEWLTTVDPLRHSLIRY